MPGALGGSGDPAAAPLRQLPVSTRPRLTKPRYTDLPLGLGVTVTTSPAPTSTAISTSTTATPSSTTTTLAPGAFVGTVATVTASDVPYSWRPGCPVSPSQLRMLKLSYWGFDNQPHLGSMVVNATVTADVLTIFSRLFAEHFPIHQMQPVDAYHGSDPMSMTADNTSGFNCRDAGARYRRSGRCTPTAKPSTSTPSRTPTSRAEPSCPGGRRLPRPIRRRPAWPWPGVSWYRRSHLSAGSGAVVGPHPTTSISPKRAGDQGFFTCPGRPRRWWGTGSRR